jgi:DNA-binding MarR family transcriptional regulator
MDVPQEPRWLDPDEQQAWRALAGALVRLPAALDAQLRRDAGISHFEYQVLALLSEAPGRTLATLTGQGQAKVTQAAPGHAQEVRRLVLDPLTKTQARQLREISRRITRAIDPGH